MSNETDKVVFKSKQDKALTLAYGVMKSMSDEELHFTKDDVFLVWFCKTLQNWKALVSASYANAPFVEVTHNGNQKETYIDVYRKLENVVIPD